MRASGPLFLNFAVVAGTVVYSAVFPDAAVLAVYVSGRYLVVLIPVSWLYFKLYDTLTAQWGCN